MTTKLQETDLNQEARELGATVVERAVEEAHAICAWEKRRIAKQVEPEIERLTIRQVTLAAERRELEGIIQRAPAVDLASLRRARSLYLALAVFLVAGGILFAHLALSPFGLGWEMWVFAIALGLVAAFLVDQTLEVFDSARLVRITCGVALAASLTGLLLLAIIRGDVLLLYLQTALAAGLDADPSAAANFYQSAGWKLRVLFALLSLGMELACGLAVRRARSINLEAYEAAEKARQRLAAINVETAENAQARKTLETAADLFEASFNRDFYRGFAERARRLGLKYVTILALAVALLLGAPRAGAEALDVVVALDLTLSMAQVGYDGRRDTTRNINALARLALALPAGARITVLGITDQSFSRPYVLLEGTLPTEHGPLQFVDQVDLARRRVAAEVRRLNSIQPRYARTDIFGVLRVVADLFDRDIERRKVLVLYSDMRHSTGEINLETPSVIAPEETLARVARLKLQANLSGVEVWAYGVHAAGKDARYWESLKSFWASYFRQSGARLRAFSLASDVPSFGEGGGRSGGAR